MLLYSRPICRCHWQFASHQDKAVSTHFVVRTILEFAGSNGDKNLWKTPLGPSFRLRFQTIYLILMPNDMFTILQVATSQSFGQYDIEMQQSYSDKCEYVGPVLLLHISTSKVCYQCYQRSILHNCRLQSQLAIPCSLLTYSPALRRTSSSFGQTSFIELSIICCICWTKINGAFV